MIKRKTNPVKIAISDDQAMFATSLAEALSRDFGFQVLWISLKGQDLISRLSSTPILPDVLLLDLNMKPHDGLEVLKWIQEHRPQLKVLIVTLHDNHHMLQEVLTLGASGIVMKDEEIGVLAKAILEVHEKGAFISQHTSTLLFNIIKMSRSKSSGNPNLTPRESEFLRLCADPAEYTYKEMAAKMGISKRTVDGYRDILFEKLGVRRRVGLVNYAHQVRDQY